jgi:glutamate formiminotransferase/formiminotetrahydrofolate cyclodeaminase
MLECIPNFSEGNDPEIIKSIAQEIRDVDHVFLLDIDQGASVNRTVMTFAGNPPDVIEAAYRAIKKAAELIDMRKQKGRHPRMGATDVCPVVPLYPTSMDEAISYSVELARRVGDHLSIPVYCYEETAYIPRRKYLANCRGKGYETLQERMKHQEWQPDFGPAAFAPKTGATVIGARNFLIAYNINLETTSTEIAKIIARNIREFGKSALPHEEGMKHLRAIGWFIPEFNRAQVSVNITDFNETPLYKVFDRIKQEANHHHTRVTGSELIGLIPKKALIDTGKYVLQHASEGTQGKSEFSIIQAAIAYLGLSELRPFDIQKKVLEYAIENAQ